MDVARDGRDHRDESEGEKRTSFGKSLQKFQLAVQKEKQKKINQQQTRL